MNNALVAGAVAVAASLWMFGQAVPLGLQVVVKVEARRVAGQDTTDQATRIINQELPDGSAEVTYVTDGRAVRSTTSGTLFGLSNGTVRLVPPGSASTYVLNPTDMTYYAVSEAGRTIEGLTTTVTFHGTAVSRSVVGYKTQRVTASFRKTLPLPSGAPPSTAAFEIAGEIENWCTSDLAMPSAMAASIDVAQRFLGSDAPEYRRKCPVALQSTVTMSTLPGFAIVSCVQSVTRVKQPPATDFVLPKNYRESRHPGM